MSDAYVYEVIRKMIQTEISNLKLSTGHWHLGKIDSIKSNNILSVYVNGSLIPQDIPSNPDGNYYIGSNVWVIFVNGDSKNKFVISRRAV